MSASRQQNALSPLQRMEDLSGTAMPTLASPQEHADPPGVAGDLVQEGPRSINRRGDEAAAHSSFASRGSDPSGVSYQSHQTHESHFTAGAGSGPDFKDQVRGSVAPNPNNNILFSDIVFAENVRPVPMSVAANESLSHKDTAAPAPPRKVPPDTRLDTESQQPPPRAPLPHEDGGQRRCSKRTLIFVALIAIVVGIVGGVVGAMSSSSNNKSPPVDEDLTATDVPAISSNESPTLSPTEAPVVMQAPTSPQDSPTVSPTGAPVVTQAPTSAQDSPTVSPTQAPTSAPVARDIAIVEFIKSITISDSVITYPRPTSAATPEEAAVIWLIENTSLSVGDPSDEFRLTQKYALLVLYYATQGDAWTNNEGWLDSTTDECNWNGITCDNNVLVNGIPQNVVTGIHQNGNNLNGDFPADIALLQDLRLLHLWDNLNLAGQIPASIGLLSSIVEFSVGNCDMSGPLPEGISNWINLQEVSGLQGWVHSVLSSLSCPSSAVD